METLTEKIKKELPKEENKVYNPISPGREPLKAQTIIKEYKPEQPKEVIEAGINPVEEFIKGLPAAVGKATVGGLAELGAKLFPAEPVFLTTQEKERQIKPPKSSEIAVELASYLVPGRAGFTVKELLTQVPRMLSAGITKLGLSEGNTKEALFSALYGVTPAGKTRVEQALKEGLTAGAIETGRQTTKALKGEDVDLINIPVSVLAGMTGGLLTKPGAVEDKNILSAFGAQPEKEDILKKALRNLDIAKEKVNKHIELKTTGGNIKKLQELHKKAKAIADKVEKKLQELPETEKRKLQEAIKLQELENERLVNYVAKKLGISKEEASLRIALTSSREGAKTNLAKALKDEAEEKIKDLANKGAKDIHPRKTLMFARYLMGDKEATFLDDNFLNWLGIDKKEISDKTNGTLAYLIARELKNKGITKEIADFPKLQQAVYRTNRKENIPLLEGDIKKAEELWGFKEGLGINEAGTGERAFYFSAGHRLAKGAPEEEPIARFNVAELTKGEREALKTLEPQGYTKEVKQGGKAHIELYSMPFLDPALAKKLLKNIAKNLKDWFKPAPSTNPEVRAWLRAIEEGETAEQFLKDPDKKLRILNLVVSLGQHYGYKPREALLVHAINGGDILKTADALASKINIKDLVKTKGVNKNLYKAYVEIAKYYKLDKRNPEQLLGKLEKEIFARLTGQPIKKSKKEQTFEFMEYLANYYRTALLSNPSTHLKNVIGNTAMLVVKMLDDANEQMLRWLTRSKDKRIKKVLLKDFKGYIKALVNLGKLRIYLDALSQETKLDPNVATKNPVFKLLEKEDGIFKWFLLNAESVKTGREIEDLLLDKEVMKRINSYVFADNAKLTAHLLRFFADYPFLKFFFPFIRTPFNMTAELFKRMLPVFPSRWTYEGFARAITFWQLVALAVLLGDKYREVLEKIEGFGQAMSGLAGMIEAKIEGNKKKEYLEFRKFKKLMQQSTTIGSVYKAIQILITWDWERAARNVVRGFIPNIIRRQALASYPYSVYQPGLEGVLKASIPGLRSELPRNKKYGDYIRYNVDTPLEALFTMYVEPEWTEKQKLQKQLWDEIAYRRYLMKELKKKLRLK